MSCEYYFEAVLLSESEIQNLSGQIVHYSQVVRRYRSSKYPWMDMDKFRKFYNKGQIAYPKEVTIAMSSLRELSGKMVYAFGKLAFSIASSFRAVPGTVKHDEYMSECLAAIDSCCYGYDGSTKFITYVTVSMQRRLIEYKKDQCRNEIPESELSKNKVEENNDTVLTAAVDNRSNEIEMIHNAEILNKAINMAGLSDLEKALIEAELLGVKGFRASVAKKFFNPHTKKPISRMAAGFAYQRALDKIRFVLERVAA